MTALIYKNNGVACIILAAYDGQKHQLCLSVNLEASVLLLWILAIQYAFSTDLEQWLNYWSELFLKYMILIEICHFTWLW